MRKLLPVILLVLLWASNAAAKQWRSILPMHSTRAEVEALLGPPPVDKRSSAHGSVYSLDDGEVLITFATEDLVQQSSCASIAIGTVMTITVTPKGEPPVSSLKLDEKLYRKFDPAKDLATGYEGFVDEKEGHVIRALRGKVQQVVYFASDSDRVRCPVFFENPEAFVQAGIRCGARFDEYGDLTFADEQVRLDNLAVQLMNQEDAQGHIIVYAGRKATVAQAQTRADRARNYIINVRHINPDRVKAIDGGHREELIVVLFVVPAGAEPPPLTPTVEPSQVELIYDKTRRRQKKPSQPTMPLR